GKIYFNLGEISEDVLKDGRKQYENGLGPDQLLANPRPIWGNVPASQSLIYTFDSNANNRTNQDIGLDGLKNDDEAATYSNFSTETDPAADDYNYYLNASGDVINRYKNYNGTDGNSAVSVDTPNRGSTTFPDVEDINRDNTMNTINAYYEYSVAIEPSMQVGQNFITDIRNTQVELPNGGTTEARWIQFKIPVSQPQNTIGSISDFRSIRFMRLFMTGFSSQLTVRFGALDLVRGEWRRYANTLDSRDTNVDDDNTDLDVLAVNLQQNNERCPINYITPPGVVREQLYNNNTVVNQDEQSLSLRVAGDGLESGDARGVFKNVSVDMRQFNKLKMFLHAESLPNEIAIRDNQMIGFIRIGNDFTQNFYQIEIPLKVTLPSSSANSNCSPLSPEVVWPEENQIDLALDLLTKLKIKSMSIDPTTLPQDGIYYQNEEELDPKLANKPNKLRLGIKGNPNFGLVRTLMVGVKSNEDSRRIKGEVWFNELRLADMDNNGGMAAILNIDSNMADFATISASGKKSTIGFGTLEQGPNERDREDIQQYNIVTNLNLGKLLPKKWGVNLPFNYGVAEEIITPEYDPFNQDIKLNQLLDNTTDAARKDNIRNRAIDYTKRTSINFIGVRKEKNPESKSHLYDPENFTFSQSINEVQRHDFEIEDYSDQQVTTSVDFSYAFNSKPLEPFKKASFMKKSNYWKLLQDFNFNFLPANISFNSDIVRQYNRQQFRQVEGVEGIGLDALYRRNYAFNYQYGFNYNLSKSLKLNYSASSGNIVKSYLNPDNTSKNDLTVWDDYWNIGTPNQHQQQIVVNYELPINKIPLFSFVKATYSYTADYSWQRASEALSKIEIGNNSYNLGNTIQNANSNNLNATFNMESLYRYLGVTKSQNNVNSRPKPVVSPKPGEKIVKSNTPQNQSSPFVDGLIGVLTSLKNVQMNYTLNSGTVLPGYTPGIGFFGTSKPTLGFVFGSQDDVRYEAAKNGWLTNYPEFNQNFTQVQNKIFKASANVDLFPDLKIDLTLDRSYSENFSEQYDVTSGNYNSRSPYSSGIFSISTVLINTSFLTSDAVSSAAFDDFRENRLIVANRLATQRGIDITNPANISEDGFPKGFGKNNQAVLLPAFLAAYSGENAASTSLGIFKSIPLPNWSLKYNGFMKFEFFKNNFKRVSLQHNYRASYTINAFRSNFEFDKDPSGVDKNGNFFNSTIMSNINLVEQFSPLVRFDFELKNSLKVLTEIKKDRALSMSFDNNLLTEVKGVEYVIGLGYRFKDVIFSSRLADNPTGIIKSDINIKADISLRDNQTIVRYLDYNKNQLAAGQNIWTLKLTADYSFSKNLTAIFYYDHSFSKAVVSTTFPLTNIRSGFTLRYNFGN
ncbi:MAG: cell surface protein SprA, partial [Flavobacterium sp.]|nr:cell surface protein SprA [Flavobacterium sp.]